MTMNPSALWIQQMFCRGATKFQPFQLAKDQKPRLTYRVALGIAKTTSSIILAGMLGNNLMNVELT